MNLKLTLTCIVAILFFANTEVVAQSNQQTGISLSPVQEAKAEKTKRSKNTEETLTEEQKLIQSTPELSESFSQYQTAKKSYLTSSRENQKSKADAYEKAKNAFEADLKKALPSSEGKLSNAIQNELNQLKN